LFQKESYVIFKKYAGHVAVSKIGLSDTQVMAVECKILS